MPLLFAQLSAKVRMTPMKSSKRYNHAFLPRAWGLADLIFFYKTHRFSNRFCVGSGRHYNREPTCPPKRSPALAKDLGSELLRECSDAL
jgi:hypothetical protein